MFMDELRKGTQSQNRNIPQQKAKIKLVHLDGTYDITTEYEEEFYSVVNLTNSVFSIDDVVYICYLDNDTSLPVIFGPNTKNDGGGVGRSIVSVSKISTVGLVDTYRILFSDESFTDYNIVNGEQGIQGEQGIPGQKGDKGDKGDKGEPGYVSQDVINQIIATVESNLLERDHPPGSPYFTFLVDDDPNDRFPGTNWVRIEENTYLVSAGPNLVGMTPIGSNNKTLTKQQLPSGITGTISAGAGSGGTNGAGVIRTPSGVFSNDTSSTLWTKVMNSTQSLDVDAVYRTISFDLGGQSQSFDNRPKSLAIYIWRRIA